MSIARGRGFSSGIKGDSMIQTQLRRPGQSGLQSRLGSLPQLKTETHSERDIESTFASLCDDMGKMNLSNSKEELDSCAKKITDLCDSLENLEKFVSNLLKFAAKSKWNCHVSAVFCDSHGDISVGQNKLRTLVLRKLQAAYIENTKSHSNKDKFVLDATFACEIFHHVRIDGACIKVLSNPILDYLGMLVEGGSLKEVEVYAEQFPKCSKTLKENEPKTFDCLIAKVRKQIINSTELGVRAMLLQIFESVLSDWQPLDENSKFLYESLSKPIIRICD